MVFDTIDHADNYVWTGPDVSCVLEKVKEYNPENYPGGKVEIDGERIYLLLNSYETRTRENALCEAHKAYLDVMYMVEGEEDVYVKPVSQLRQITQPYSSSIDALLAQTDEDASVVHLTAGSFLVLYPQDAHAPGCCVHEPMQVKKIVAKIRIDAE